ncbi:MAG TPA: hypothetical protein VGM98_11065 [Schlesneria sp.]|jgi:hypothetical protein
MLSPEMAGIDLIDELQLRHWARTNYVAADTRESDWHPIVLDEMRRRDEELSEGRNHSRQVGMPIDACP